MDRNKERCVGLQEAMAEEQDEQVEVKRFCGRCPIGGCSKEGMDMGKGYEDNGDMARKRVWNHIRWSPQHRDLGLNSDQDVTNYMEANEHLWLDVSVQLWEQNEFDQLMADQGVADEPDNSVPEPAGKPRARPKYKGKGKGKGQEQGRKGGNKSIDDELRWQIKQQTQNMLHFSKASSVCIASLRVAKDMCDQASTTFSCQKAAMEAGIEEMIEAFGIEPPRRSRNMAVLHELGGGGSSSQIDLARHVRRDRPY